MSEREEERCEVAVVGAGLSGLSVARCFCQHNFTDFKLFEASSRVGGRTLSDQDGTDLGGAYVGPTQDRLMSVVDELGLRVRKVNTVGKTVQLLNGVVTSYDGLIPPVSLLGALDLNSAMVHIDEVVAGVNEEAPHLSKNANELDKITGEEFICKMTYTEDARKILRTAVRSILCVEPCQLSALYLVWYIAQSGGVKRIFETQDGAQDCKIVGGAGRIAPLLAEKYTPEGSNRLEVNCPIRSLEIVSSDDSNEETSVKLTASSGKIIHAKRVILAIPPVQMLRLQYTPSLPASRYNALQNWPMGCICKTFVYYKTPFWRDMNMNGTIVCDEGIVCVSYDDTNEDGSNACLMGFVLANQALVDMSLEERKVAICQRYQKCFKNDQALNPIHYKEKKWSEEQWVGGCYVGSVGPNVLTSSRRVQCEVYSSVVHIAGTEAAYRSVGYMDGAIESGERIARNVLVDLSILGASYKNIVSSPTPSVQLPFVPIKITFIEKCLPSVGTVLGLVAVLVAIVTGKIVCEI